MESFYDKTRLAACIRELEELLPHPESGIGSQMFEYLSKITPIVNVDLLIKNKEGSVLLSWRQDECGTGWHIPGGIIRYKETAKERIRKVMKEEIGVSLGYQEKPLAIEEIIMDQETRGHFISLLYQCYIKEASPRVKETPPFKPGDLKWHKSFPENMVKGQREVYRKYFNETR